MKAWLITLEGTSEGIPIHKKVLSILPPRSPSNRVREFVEQLYVDQFLLPNERIAYLKNRRNLAYPAEIDTINGTQVSRITCGHNPFIIARPVQNLKIVTDEQGIETFSWEKRQLAVTPNI